MKLLILICTYLSISACASIHNKYTSETCVEWAKESGLYEQYVKTGDIEIIKAHTCSTNDFYKHPILGSTDWPIKNITIRTDVGAKTRKQLIAHEFCHAIANSNGGFGHDKVWEKCMRKYGQTPDIFFDGDYTE